MKIYIIEDDLSVIGVLEDIVERNGLGSLCGDSGDGAPDLDRVLALEEEFRGMDDDRLREMTPRLKKRLAEGESLDDILPEAFAACREAASRVLTV